MPKKVMIICGSARRNGNTATVANWVAAGAREVGADVEIVDASRLEVKLNGCLHCLGCKNSEEYRCVVKDDVSSVVSRMLDQDVVVFATPVHFGGVSAQIKMVIDRMYCFLKYEGLNYWFAPALREISMALIATAGHDEKHGLEMTSEYMALIMGGLSKDFRKLLVPFAPPEPGQLANDSDLQQKAVALGRELVLTERG